MTTVACLALGAAAPGPRALALHTSALGTLAEVSAADFLRLAASLALLATLWWPFVVAAIAGAWLLFRKAGRPGWACLVPGYNAVEFLRIAKLPAWLAVLFLVPVANVALFVVACFRVARAFRKGPRFAAGLVLLPPFYAASLGLGPARYRRFDVLDGKCGSKPDPAAPRVSASPPDAQAAVLERAAIAAAAGGRRRPGMLHLVGTDEPFEPSAPESIHTLDLA